MKHLPTVAGALLGLIFVFAGIVAFHAFVTGGMGLWDPMLVAVCLLTAYLLWCGRGALAALVASPQG